MEVTHETIAVSESKGKAKLKVLIVEDDRISSKILDGYLSDCSDCDAATNGVEGIEAFKTALQNCQPYDLICLDIMMPIMNGYDALKAIRQFEQDCGVSTSNGVKVIMTTAKEDTDSIKRAFKEGCNAYILKPIIKEKLYNEMQNLELVNQ